MQGLFAIEAFLASMHAAVVKYTGILGQADLNTQCQQHTLTPQAQALLRHGPPDDEAALRDFIRSLRFRLPTLLAAITRLAPSACYQLTANPFTFLDEVDAQLEQHGQAQISAAFFSKHLRAAMASLQERYIKDDPTKLQACMDQLKALQCLMTAFTDLAASSWSNSAADAAAKTASLAKLMSVFRDQFEPTFIEQRSLLAAHVHLIKQIISHLAVSIFQTCTASLLKDNPIAVASEIAMGWSLPTRPLTVQDLPATLQLSATADHKTLLDSLRLRNSEVSAEEIETLLEPFVLHANLLIFSMPDICKAVCEGLNGCLWAFPVLDVMQVSSAGQSFQLASLTQTKVWSCHCLCSCD